LDRADRNGSLKSHFTGAGILHFTGDALKKYKILVPPQAELMQILNKLDALHSECRKLAELYETKLTALAELKQSLLQKAFASELT